MIKQAKLEIIPIVARHKMVTHSQSGLDDISSECQESKTIDTVSCSKVDNVALPVMEFQGIQN